MSGRITLAMRIKFWRDIYRASIRAGANAAAAELNADRAIVTLEERFSDKKEND